MRFARQTGFRRVQAFQAAGAVETSSRDIGYDRFLLDRFNTGVTLHRDALTFEPLPAIVGSL